MQATGPVTFAVNRDGTPRQVRRDLRRRRGAKFSAGGLNSALRWLRAALHLAHREGLIDAPWA
jgi:hypothetical protein